TIVGMFLVVNPLDRLLAEADLTPPASEVEHFLSAGIHVRRMELAQARITGEKAEELLREMAPELRAVAEARAKAHVYLLAAASRENIRISEKELEDGIARMASGSRGNPEELRRSIMSGPAADELREKMLAGKTLAHIYDKARKITAPTPEAPAGA
ncbi:MAG: hypothetical protein MJ061_04985, partial [Mailhella sp.]|nr:hypothetical protein [Mailhella sp.]